MALVVAVEEEEVAVEMECWDVDSSYKFDVVVVREAMAEVVVLVVV